MELTIYILNLLKSPLKLILYNLLYLLYLHSMHIAHTSLMSCMCVYRWGPGEGQYLSYRSIPDPKIFTICQ